MILITLLIAIFKVQNFNFLRESQIFLIMITYCSKIVLCLTVVGTAGEDCHDDGGFSGVWFANCDMRNGQKYTGQGLP